MNSKLKEKFGVNSFPTIIVLDSRSEEINRITGYNKLIGNSKHFTFIENCITEKSTG